MNWLSLFKNKLIPTKNLDQMYWHMEPSLVSMSLGIYSELSLGWIYEGLYDRNRHGYNKHQLIGKGWYRHQLGIL